MNFLSDNASGVAPEILSALTDVNEGKVPAYGADGINEALAQTFGEIFECDLDMFLVATGTGANSLSLAVLSPPYGAIFCHEQAHVNTDECGAPEFFTQGAKLVGLSGADAKFDAQTLDQAVAHFPRGVEHRMQPGAVTLSQATELGTIYSVEDIEAISAAAKKNELPVHMDGARFANALVELGCTPAEMTWKAGVDVLSFGATKNGAMAAEAVLFFNRDLVGDFKFRQKRGGQLFSKARFPAAQFAAYFHDDLWLQLARTANQKARDLWAAIESTDRAHLVSPVETNAVFVDLKVSDIQRLQKAGSLFHAWTPTPVDGRLTIRLVTSFATTDDEISAFVDVVSAN